MARILRDDIDRFYDYGLNVPTRTIYMGSMDADLEDGAETGVDYVMAERVIKGLHLLDASSEDPIHIIMNNPGGDEFHGLAIYDCIQACRSHVTITVFGMAMSMGSIILQAADDRIMSPNSKMMIHYGTWGGWSNHPKIIYSWAEEGKRFDKWMVNLYWEKLKVKDPKITKKQVDQICNFDKFYTAQEAVEKGLADKVLGE